MIVPRLKHLRTVSIIMSVKFVANKRTSRFDTDSRHLRSGHKYFRLRRISGNSICIEYQEMFPSGKETAGDVSEDQNRGRKLDELAEIYAYDRVPAHVAWP